MSLTMYKAVAVGAELADSLQKRLNNTGATYTMVQGTDNGYPTYTFWTGSLAAGQKVMFFKINQLTWANATNSIGNTQDIYDKVVIQMVTEKNYEGATDNVLDILGPAQLLPLLGDLLKKGVRLEWYRTNNGTVPSVAGITGTPDGSYDPMLYFPGVGW